MKEVNRKKLTEVLILHRLIMRISISSGICILLLIAHVIPAFCQDIRSVKITGTVYDKSDGEKMESFVVEIYDGNSIVHSPKEPKNGSFEANLPAGIEYTFEISMAGYYPKRLVANTVVPSTVKKIPTLFFEVELLRKSEYEAVEQADVFATSVFDMPYVIFEWKEDLEEFGYREEYTNFIKKKYEEVSGLR